MRVSSDALWDEPDDGDGRRLPHLCLCASLSLLLLLHLPSTCHLTPVPALPQFSEELLPTLAFEVLSSIFSPQALGRQ